MEKVYIVYHDNGMDNEEHSITVSRIFISKESAESYAKAENFKCKTFNPYTKEEWESMHPDYSYSDYWYNAQIDYDYDKYSTYYVEEYELNP